MKRDTAFLCAIAGAKLLLHATHGKDDPERATLPFVVANVAANADQETVVLLTIDGVWLATKGYADGIHKEGFPALKDVLASFVANGGQVWACGTCTKQLPCCTTGTLCWTACWAR